MEMMTFFCEREQGCEAINFSFIFLIPKVLGAKEVGDFRHIGLINGVMKIVTKVLTNRLKTVVGKLLTEE